ncbi:hypothetical protein GCM10029992_53490 [Glycomyces albus]
MRERRFRDRREAGRVLAGLLDRYRGRSDLLVLGLPRGGVPVAFEVAEALGAPLEALTVRKLGVPGHEELALGAIATGGIMVVDAGVARGFGVDGGELNRIAERERAELERRERAYRSDHEPPQLRGKTVLLIDDGLATGSTMKAAIRAARAMEPAWLAVAVPTAPSDVRDELARLVDDLVCVTSPEPFTAVGRSYREFGQTGDDEVRELLRLGPGGSDESQLARHGRGLASGGDVEFLQNVRDVELHGVLADVEDFGYAPVAVAADQVVQHVDLAGLSRSARSAARGGDPPSGMRAVTVVPHPGTASRSNSAPSAAAAVAIRRTPVSVSVRTPGPSSLTVTRSAPPLRSQEMRMRSIPAWSRAVRTAPRTRPAPRRRSHRGGPGRPVRAGRVRARRRCIA